MATKIPQVSIRAVQLTDSPTIWRWRNHPTTRKYFNHPREIPLHRHERWFAERFIDPAPWFLGLQRGIPVGVVRFDGGDGNYDISVVVAPAYRGKGIGKALLGTALKAVRSKCHAFVHSGNVASEKLFASVGFKCIGSEWVR